MEEGWRRQLRRGPCDPPPWPGRAAARGRGPALAFGVAELGPTEAPLVPVVETALTILMMQLACPAAG